MEQQPRDTQFSSGWAGFTSDWFSHRIPAWRKYILPVFKDKPCHWLEIGSYEGRSAVWTLEHILTHPESSIDCIDPWDKVEVLNRFKSNTNNVMNQLGRPGSVFKHQGYSHNIIPQFQNNAFDVIYVDGDHQAKSALTDAIMAWQKLKPGGFMIFDDYKWDFLTEHERKTKIPACKGIDAFLNFWHSELTVVHKDYQVIVQKSSK